MERETREARTAGLCALILGLVGFLGRISGHVFGPDFAATLSHANLAASILEIALAAGLLRQRRAAWAFAIMGALMVSIMNLFAWPEFHAMGSKAALSMIVAGARVGFIFVLLWAAGAYRRTGT